MRTTLFFPPMSHAGKPQRFMLLIDCRDECWITWLGFSSQAWTQGTLGAGRFKLRMFEYYEHMGIINGRTKPNQVTLELIFILGFPWWGINSEPCVRCHSALLHCTGLSTLDWSGESADLQHLVWWHAKSFEMNLE